MIHNHNYSFYKRFFTLLSCVLARSVQWLLQAATLKGFTLPLEFPHSAIASRAPASVASALNYLYDMRDMATKMAELKFEAPLAQFEETEDWGIIDFHHQNTGAATTMSSVATENNLTTQDAKNSNNLEPLCASTMSSNLSVMANNTSATLDNAATLPLQLANSPQVTPITDSMSTLTVTSTLPHDNVSDNFTETFSGSLEDLVNTFDDKITKCFCNYDESVEKLAPVQVRTQEEIMNECQ